MTREATDIICWYMKQTIGRLMTSRDSSPLSFILISSRGYIRYSTDGGPMSLVQFMESAYVVLRQGLVIGIRCVIVEDAA
jgi:hypothetical protein